MKKLIGLLLVAVFCQPVVLGQRARQQADGPLSIVGSFKVTYTGAAKGTSHWRFTEDNKALEKGKEKGTWKMQRDVVVITYNDPKLGAVLLQFRDPDSLVGYNRWQNGKVYVWRLDREADKPELGMRKIFLSELRDSNREGMGNWFSKDGRVRLGSDKNPKYFPVTIDGEKSPHGIYMHPGKNSSARVVYDMDELRGQQRPAQRRMRFDGHFSAKVVIPNVTKEQTDPATPLVFELVGHDGHQADVLWKSKPVSKRDEPQECEVDFKAVLTLELRVRCPGANNWALAFWVEPRLLDLRPAGTGMDRKEYAKKVLEERKSRDEKKLREELEQPVKYKDDRRAERDELIRRYGFDKLDYTKGPNGEPLVTKQEKVKTKLLSGKEIELDGTVHFYLDKDGKQVKHGREVKWYRKPNDASDPGKPYQEDYWYAGQLNGLTLDWHANGRLATLLATVSGKSEGTSRGWCFHGSPQYQGVYKNGLKEGEWRSWYGPFNPGSPGGLESVSNWHDGKLSGPETVYDVLGGKVCYREWKDGKLHGKSIFYDNGRPKDVAWYENGIVVRIEP